MCLLQKMDRAPMDSYLRQGWKIFFNKMTCFQEQAVRKIKKGWNILNIPAFLFKNVLFKAFPNTWL
ncbi:protein of unknown function [Maridesulfovibrio hydrothermalis AM13 = DSM 14728]|uniref:Uncharacterized protein n=1 Tax=Maridesulfovibrio hydrothermalis AM13 = DSM 14728 TaxID=1121451 RepID=L0RFE5_9BACT|nr:protein of unknown function [Maridesulfovibrio hydrothermalis AM13 = DSM 14728]